VLRVAIIGAGPSGMMAALEASKGIGRGIKSVTLFEHEARIGRKLAVTGAGRCNLSNDGVSASVYHGAELEWTEQLLECFSVEDLERALYRLGIPIFKTDDGWYYPLSQSAASVVSILEERLLGQGVSMRVATYVRNVSYQKDHGFELTYKDYNSGKSHVELFDRLIVATGGKSYPELGSKGQFFAQLEGLGHTVNRLSPALGLIEVNLGRFNALQGLRFDAHTAVFNGEECLGRSFGNLIFTKKGLNGPGVMNLSHLITQNSNQKLQLEINFIGQWIEELAEAAVDENNQGSLRALLLRYFAPKAVDFFINEADLKPQKALRAMTEEDFQKLIQTLSMNRFDVTGAGDYSNSQLTAGGVATEELNPQTLESKIVLGLFIVGEAIDLFGPCGGYNLHVAFATGYLAGKTLAEH
jgi:predicted Rossmann fold flavoprotein